MPTKSLCAHGYPTRVLKQALPLGTPSQLFDFYFSSISFQPISIWRPATSTLPFLISSTIVEPCGLAFPYCCAVYFFSICLLAIGDVVSLLLDMYTFAFSLPRLFGFGFGRKKLSMNVCTSTSGT